VGRGFADVVERDVTESDEREVRSVVERVRGSIGKAY